MKSEGWEIILNLTLISTLVVVTMYGIVSFIGSIS